MTKSRKRMLISSIAMLLVALVALGSATYAWYINNNTVTASSTQFSAASASGLVIRHTVAADSTWKKDITDLAHATGLTPASISYDTLTNNVGGTAQGTSFTNGAINGTPSKAAISNGQTFYVEEFYVASSSSSAETAYVYVKGSPVEGTYMNLAVYAGNTLLGVVTSDTASSGTTGKFEANGESAVKVASGTQAVSKMVAGDTGVYIGSFQATAKSDTLTEASGVKITVIGFADGFNPICTSELANTANVSATFSFTTEAPAQEP